MVFQILIVQVLQHICPEYFPSTKQRRHEASLVRQFIQHACFVEPLGEERHITTLRSVGFVCFHLFI